VCRSTLLRKSRVYDAVEGRGKNGNMASLINYLPQ
jgi:hypothetical protein